SSTLSLHDALPILNLLFGQKLRYYQGPCVYPTGLARSLPTTTRGFFFLAEMLIQALRRGRSFVEVGLVHQERAHGRSKAVTLRNAARALTTVARLWWRLRLASTAGPERGTRACTPRSNPCS